MSMGQNFENPWCGQQDEDQPEKMETGHQYRTGAAIQRHGDERAHCPGTRSDIGGARPQQVQSVEDNRQNANLYFI